jgi:hypothetical protein
MYSCIICTYKHHSTSSLLKVGVGLMPLLVAEDRVEQLSVHSLPIVFGNKMFVRINGHRLTENLRSWKAFCSMVVTQVVTPVNGGIGGGA